MANKQQIYSRWDDSKVLFECELSAEVQNKSLHVKTGFAIRLAIKEKANLGGADLGGAYLGGADLAGAYLAGAYLADADLADAYLRGADLGDAYLRGVNLRDANLGGANLRGANLGGANLRGANLRDANLGGADLGGADLGGANLGGVNLGDAYLRGVNLGDAGKLIGERPILIIGNVGSDNSYLQAYNTDKGIFMKRGCFFGSLKEFKNAVEEKHKGTVHCDEYNNLINFVENHFKIWEAVTDGK